MAAEAYSEIAILGLTYAEDVAGSLETSDDDPLSFDTASQQESVPTTEHLDFQAPCSCSKEDFIIFAEFSEVQGPLPLLTIPFHIQDNSDIDINTFILRIMSVDYQTNQSGGQFVVSEDAQMLQLSVVRGLHTFAHYFTLYDIHARGFVRPMCLAYVSRDNKKLQTIFPELRERFLKMTHLIKSNNRQGFFEELSTRTHDLKCKQEKYFALKQAEENTDGPHANGLIGSPEIQSLVQQYTEYKYLQHTIEPTLGDKNVQEVLACWEDVVRSSNHYEVRQFLKVLNRNPPGKSIRPLLAISPWGCLAALYGLSGTLHGIYNCPLKVQLNDLWGYDEAMSSTKEVKIEDALTEAKLALQSPEYLNLIQRLTFPKEHQMLEPTELTLSCEGEDTHLVASGTESCSSFHSARDELPLSSEGSEGEYFVEAEAEIENDEIWSTCIWGHCDPPSQQTPGLELMQLFSKHQRVAQHLIYAILTGRPLILTGSPQHREHVLSLVRALKPVLPPTHNTPNGQPLVLSWHQGILVGAHLEKYHLIGLCVPERLTFHDLMSPKDKNIVTIFDVVNSQVFGPAYSGSLLSTLDPARVDPMLAGGEPTLLLIIRAALIGIMSKVHLARCLQRNSSPSSHGVLGLKGCDLTIVKHLAATLPPLW